MLKKYSTYEWPKVSYHTFYKRIKLWLSFEESIKPWHRAKLKNKLDYRWRICTKCKVYKLWISFNKWANKCKECCAIIHKEYHLRNREKILQKKKEKRDSNLGKLKTRLDSIFYRDKNNKYNISLEPENKRDKRRHNWDIMKDKFFYFLSRWYDRKILSQLYWNHYLDNYE